MVAGTVNSGFFGPDRVPASEATAVLVSKERLDRLERYEKALQEILQLATGIHLARRIAREALDGTD